MSRGEKTGLMQRFSPVTPRNPSIPSSPHDWAVGRTFTFTITLPEPSNAGGRPPSRAKQAGKKTRKPSTQGRTAPKAKQTKPRTAPTPAPPEAERREQL